MLAPGNRTAAATTQLSGTSPSRQRFLPYGNGAFEPPVGIYFGKPRQIMLVGSVREAAGCLLSGFWPDRGSEAFDRGLWCLTAALQGRCDSDQARLAFEEAAKAAGIFVKRELTTH
jgi:hypothetical protein